MCVVSYTKWRCPFVFQIQRRSQDTRSAASYAGTSECLPRTAVRQFATTSECTGRGTPVHSSDECAWQQPPDNGKPGVLVVARFSAGTWWYANVFQMTTHTYRPILQFLVLVYPTFVQQELGGAALTCQYNYSSCNSLYPNSAISVHAALWFICLLMNLKTLLWCLNL